MSTEKIRFAQVGGYDWMRLTPLLEERLRSVTSPIRYGWLIPDEAAQDGAGEELGGGGIPQPPPEADPARIGAECVYRPETGPQCSCPEWPCTDPTLCERTTQCGVTK